MPQESKHTPGPWAVSQSNPTRVTVEPGVHVNDEQEDDVWIANCDGDHFADYNHEALKANARLIAAAPNMALLLSALRAGVAEFYKPTGEIRFGGMMYSSNDTPEDYSEIVQIIGWSKLEAAIAKQGGPRHV